MMKVKYKPSFLRQYNKLPKSLKDEAREKIELFKSDPSHSFLKTHKLKGRLKGFLSFSVNYAYRVVFYYEGKNVVALVDIGGHDVYE